MIKEKTIKVYPADHKAIKQTRGNLQSKSEKEIKMADAVKWIVKKARVRS